MDVGSTVQWIVRPDKKRKAEFVKRSDGTFAFREWQFLEEEQAWGTTRIGAGSRCASLEDAVREARSRIDWLASELSAKSWYQLGWTTLPGLRGLSVSEFRAARTENPDTLRGVAAEFANDQDCGAFLRAAEAEFAARRFSNAADAFDTVKAYVLERASK